MTTSSNGAVQRPTPPLTALQLPRTLFAEGAVKALAAELSALGVRRPLLVTDRVLVNAGIAKTAMAAIGDKAEATVFDGVTENPLFSDVDNGVGVLRAQGCDCVIALGGGSVIDTAKFIALLASNPGPVSAYAGVPNVVHIRGAPLVVIPTTAGTGSEASPSAAIHPDATTASLGLNSRHLIPTVAILDPSLTRSLPPRLTAATGIDALSHCIEGYLSKKTLPMGKSLALDGIARVARSLRRAVHDGNDVEARADMMLAAFAGGASIGMGLGPAHAVALSCSDQGFAHGVLSGIGLVATLDATAREAPTPIAEVARAFGLDPSDSLPRNISNLMRELGLPATLSELGYVAHDLSGLAVNANASYFNWFAPVHPSTNEYADMLAQSLGQRG